MYLYRVKYKYICINEKILNLTIEHEQIKFSSQIAENAFLYNKIRNMQLTALNLNIGLVKEAL